MGELALRSMRATVRRLLVACLVAAAGLLPWMQSHAQDAQDSATVSSGRTSLPTSIPVKREASVEGADSGSRWWMVIPVAACLLAFAVIAARRNGQSVKPGGGWRMRFGNLSGTALPNEIQRVSSTRLTPRHSLHVVVWNGRQLLLGCTDQSVQLLAESPVVGETTELGVPQ